jgi:hypothetical protein
LKLILAPGIQPTEFPYEAALSTLPARAILADADAICYARGRMRRGIHISVSVIAVLLLLKSFDCFGSGQFTQKAADCCKKGKCVPSSNADDCCKSTLPGGKQIEACKGSQHSKPMLDLLTTNAPDPIDSSFAPTALTDFYAPTGSPPSSHFNLPLLI